MHRPSQRRTWRFPGKKNLLTLGVVACLALASTGSVGTAEAEEPAFNAELQALADELAKRDREIESLKADLSGIEPVEELDAAPEGPYLQTRFQGEPPAAPPSEGTPPVAPTLEDVMRRLEALEKAPKKADAETKPEEKKAEKGAGDKKADDGWIDLSTEKWTVKLTGHLQGDYINWANADPAIVGTQDYFEFRRARLTGEGTGYGVYEFRIMFDIEPEQDLEQGIDDPFVDLKDAYLGILEFAPLGRVRFGNFFVPFSLEQVTNDTMNIFLERSIPTQGVFAADREVGMAAYDQTADKNIAWSYGVFFDSISEGLKERVDDNQGYRVSGRLTWLPYYHEPSKGRYLVHTGTGVLYTNDQDDQVRFRTRPQIHEGPRLIDSGILNADDFATANVEAAVVAGPFSVQSEAFVSQVNMDTGDNVHLNGAYVYCSYYLTGENRYYEREGQHGAQFGRPQVFTNFFSVPGCCGTGAWELKARISYLGMNDINRGQYNDFTVGMNWYWNERTRIMFDWIHPMTSEDTTFGETESDILGTRMDFNF